MSPFRNLKKILEYQRTLDLILEVGNCTVLLHVSVHFFTKLKNSCYLISFLKSNFLFVSFFLNCLYLLRNSKQHLRTFYSAYLSWRWEYQCWDTFWLKSCHRGKCFNYLFHFLHEIFGVFLFLIYFDCVPLKFNNVNLFFYRKKRVELSWVVK